MSKNAKGVLGGQVGKIGPVVARKFRTLNVYSAYQPNVKNPRTEKQQLNRVRFAAMSELAHGFGCAVRLGLQTAVKGTDWSMRNLFSKLNIDLVTPTNVDSVDIDYTAIQISKGGLCPVHFETPLFDTPQSVAVEFDGQFETNPCQQTANDKVYLVVYSPDAKRAVVSTGVKRSEESVSVKVPADWNGTKVQVYGFVRNDGPENLEFNIAAGECSDSSYLGSGTIG